MTNLANSLTIGESIKTGVDVRKFYLPGNEFLNRELTLPPDVFIDGDVSGWHRRAEIGADDGAGLGGERERRNRGTRLG